LPKNVRFEPKYNVLPWERCKLICKVSNDSLERSFIFNDRVDDGTSCTPENDNDDICINGKCVRFGCDFKYESQSTKDMCGICNGQNRTCRFIQGKRRIRSTKKILILPVNTTFANITQISRKIDRYYLSMKVSNGKYLLNSYDNLQLYNVTFHYEKSKIFYNGFQSKRENLLITGRLNSSIEIRVISMYYRFRGPTTEVLWEYYRPFSRNDRNLFKWRMKKQGICSTRCGQGYRYVDYECLSMNEIVDEKICRKYFGKKPKRIVSCEGDCRGIGWVYGAWSEGCYLDGYCLRKRAVQCRNESDLPVSEEFCLREFMIDTERCADEACAPAKWNYSMWSECNCLSRRPSRQRDVQCIRNDRPVEDDQCAYELKPETRSLCQNQCPAPSWEIYPWQPVIGLFFCLFNLIRLFSVFDMSRYSLSICCLSIRKSLRS